MSELVDQLRDALRRPARRTSSRDAPSFEELLRNRVEQLSADMVDGAVLEPADAARHRASILAFVTETGIDELGPDRATDVLEMMEAFGYDVAGARAKMRDGAAQAFPPPEALEGPEVDALIEAARRWPDACSLEPPIENIAFVETLRAEGLEVPPELVRLLARCNGFDLACAAAPYLPVLSLLPAESFDQLDAEAGFPRRLAVFQGGDDVELAVYADRSGRWWLTFEDEYTPQGRVRFDLASLLRFAIARMNAREDVLFDELDWRAYFSD